MTILGITDEVTTCDRCGKQNLKSTYLVRDPDTCKIVYLGSDCLLKRFQMTQKQLTVAVDDYQVRVNKQANDEVELMVGDARRTIKQMQDTWNHHKQGQITKNVEYRQLCDLVAEAKISVKCKYPTARIY